nr:MULTISPECIES: Eco57I restriction-modification methylase domain-containing protein [Gilliamella]
MLNHSEIISIIEKENLYKAANLKNFVKREKERLELGFLSRIIELANNNRETHSAYYTNDFIIKDIIDLLPNFSDKDEISIIEPSVGAGNFLPYLFAKYRNKKVKLTLIDIDKDIIDILSLLYEDKAPSNFEIDFLCADFMSLDLNNVDLIVGNPPFTRISKKEIEKYNLTNQDLRNLAGCFLEKSIKIAHTVSLIMPKNLLNTPEYSGLRDFILSKNVHSIIDFGEKGFKGVLIETINIILSNSEQKKCVFIESKVKNQILNQDKNYIFDKNLPYWVIYRNAHFDSILNKMDLGVFDVFRDRQITKSILISQKNQSSIRVLRSQNISDDGCEVIDKDNYDCFIDKDVLQKLAVNKFIDNDFVYLTPNMTYNCRVMKKEKGYIVNGSVAILIPKYHFQLTKKQLLFFSSNEFREFYAVARNYQTRSLNIDACSCYWFGIYKE